MSPAWGVPRVCSVIGAAHRRQAKPCQDASLSRSLTGGDGQTLQLMAVADGHGSSRSWLSQIGSELACAAAEQAVAAALPDTPLADSRAWRQLLQRDLPLAIQRRWQAAIEADWRRRPEGDQQPLQTVTYGCTLGLVLLAPQWWGCTGLGDWDLVGVSAGGEANLLSEEDDDTAAGEATASLCLPQAVALCGQRAYLEALATPGLQGLVLSTDGVRKSCASDADFLALCSQVVALEDAGELQRGLEQITNAGSGDDVSVAIARRAPTQGRGSPRRPWRAGLILLTLVGAGLGALSLGQRPATPPAGLDPVVAQEVQRLCADPTHLRANLTPRRAQLLQLLRDPAAAQRMLASPAQDPLGALLAASRQGQLRGCTALEQQLARLWGEARSATQPPNGKMPTPAARSDERPRAGGRPTAAGSR